MKPRNDIAGAGVFLKTLVRQKENNDFFFADKLFSSRKLTLQAPAMSKLGLMNIRQVEMSAHQIIFLFFCPYLLIQKASCFQTFAFYHNPLVEYSHKVKLSAMGNLFLRARKKSFDFLLGPYCHWKLRKRRAWPVRVMHLASWLGLWRYDRLKPQSDWLRAIP